MSIWSENTKPMFLANTAFGPWDGEKWEAYKRRSGLNRLDELVSLDRMLCPLVLKQTKVDYWPHVVHEGLMLDYFTDVDFLIKETANVTRKNILCVFRNPARKPVVRCKTHSFQLFGYDLVETGGSISALSNSGGFPNVFDKDELTHNGLIGSRKRALQIQSQLRELYIDEPHADCDVWAIFRAELKH